MASTDRSHNDNFGLLPEEKRGFTSLGISALVNIVIAAVVVIISMSAVHIAHQNVFVANELVFQAPPPKPVTPPPPRIHIYAPHTQPSRLFTPKPQPQKQPPKIRHVISHPQMPNVPAPPPRKVAPPPKPKVGLFKSVNPTTVANNRSHPTVHTGGFGDPHGVHTDPHPRRKPTIVAFGSSEDAPGSGKGAGRARQGSVQGVNFGSGVAHGARGGHDHGTVASAGFNNGIAGGSGARHNHGTIAVASFGNNYGKSDNNHVHKARKPNTTPIVVTWKPLPRYTSAAMQKHIQGDVTLRVRFTANGQVKVLSVVHGLGYGLNEQAKLAAEKIRFKPATRDGHPVSAVRIIRITFQMT